MLRPHFQLRENNTCFKCGKQKDGVWILVLPIGEQPLSQIDSIFTERVGVEGISGSENLHRFSLAEECGFLILEMEQRATHSSGSVYHTLRLWPRLTSWEKKGYMEKGLQLHRVKQANIISIKEKLRFCCGKCLQSCHICGPVYPNLEIPRLPRFVHPLNPNPPYVTSCRICSNLVCERCEESRCFDGTCRSCLVRQLRDRYVTHFMETLSELNFPEALQLFIYEFVASKDIKVC
jgi:hypothetical protein